MQRALRIVLALVFSIVTCGLVLLTWVVTRNCWLMAGQLLMPSYAAFNFMDKALVIISGMVTLAFLVYSLEMYTTAEQPLALLHQFLRLAIAPVGVLGLSHMIIALITLQVGAARPALFLIPIVELLCGAACYYLDHRFDLSKYSLQSAPNLSP